MSRDAAEILRESLALPVEARAAVADTLLYSLDVEIDEDAGTQWEGEIRRRVAELDSNAVTCIPWSDARSRLAATLRNER